MKKLPNKDHKTKLLRIIGNKKLVYSKKNQNFWLDLIESENQTEGVNLRNKICTEETENSSPRFESYNMSR